jgi:hypothetical protein
MLGLNDARLQHKAVVAVFCERVAASMRERRCCVGTLSGLVLGQGPAIAVDRFC